MPEVIVSQIRLDQISDAKNCGKCSEMLMRTPRHCAAKFVLSAIALNVWIFLMKYANS